MLRRVYRSGGVWGGGLEAEAEVRAAPPQRSTHRRESHSLDIVQPVDNPLIRPAAVNPIGGIARRTRRAVGAREPVRQHLVDGPGAPLRWCRRVRGERAEDGEEEDGGGEHDTGILLWGDLLYLFIYLSIIPYRYMGRCEARAGSWVSASVK